MTLWPRHGVLEETRKHFQLNVCKEYKAEKFVSLKTCLKGTLYMFYKFKNIKNKQTKLSVTKKELRNKRWKILRLKKDNREM